MPTLDYFFPSGNRIIFSSNLHDLKERDLDLYSIKSDDSDLEGIAFFNGFNGFPIFSPNGKYIVLAFNRNKKKGDTNLFLQNGIINETIIKNTFFITFNIFTRD